MSADPATDERSTDDEAETIGPEAPVVRAADLHVSYGQVGAINGLDLTVQQGEIISLIGPNGAGKTTFTDALAGFLEYEGTLTYRGRSVADQSQSGLVGTGISYCTEKRDLFGYMSVEDNLRLGAYRRSKGPVDGTLQFVYELFPRLADRSDQYARTMSGGEQQMLAIGRGLMGNPDLLVLDEPTLGLAPVVLEDISDALDGILDAGVTVLLAEQNVNFALDHADRIYLLENGRTVRTGTPAELHGDEYIRETYLGG